MLDEVCAASRTNVAALFDRQVMLAAGRIAVESAGLTLTYSQLAARAWRLADVLRAAGVRSGDRLCLLSENDPDFVVLAIAALRLNAIVATLNPRLNPNELAHCARMVEPTVLLVSRRMRDRIAADVASVVLDFGRGSALDARLGGEPAGTAAAVGGAERGADPAGAPVDDEAIQFIIYTSGTTGLPKGAMISRRAMLARLLVYVLDYRVDGDDTFLAWSPLCHMASVELAFGTLLLGGKVAVLDGADLPVICDYLERDPVSNLIFFPGMMQQTIDFLRQRRPRLRGIKKFGALADLVAPAHIAELTRLLGVPYTNTFGSTETGMAPASAGRLEAGVEPRDFAKTQSALCEVCLFDGDDRPAATGGIGELAMRGPTLFSGYWNDEGATREAFRGGWYRSGDMFRRAADGRLSYVDRRKYLIKSGGENVYPAEIERVVLQHPAVADAVAVRRRDERWGEVPVLVVALADGVVPVPDAAELAALCRAQLAPFKVPREVLFVERAVLPRNNTGKIMRESVERWVAAGTDVPR